MASEINDALRVISDLGKVLEKTVKDYKESVGDVGRLYADTKRGANKRYEKEQEANYDAIQKTTKSLDELYKETNKWKAETKAYTKASLMTTRSLKDSAKQLLSTGPQNMSDELKDALKKIDSASSMTASEMTSLQKVIGDAITQENKLAAVEKKKIIRTRLVNDSLEQLREKSIGLSANFDRMKDGLAGSFDELQYAQAQQIGNYGVLDQGMDSFSKQMGMVPLSFQKMVAQNKSLILSAGEDYNTLEEAVGQATNSFAKVNAQNQTLMQQSLALTGDQAEASALLTGTMDTLASMGHKLSFEELRAGSDGLMKQFQSLAQISKHSSREVADMTNRFVNSAAVREKISQLQGKKERQAFLKRTMDDVRRNKLLGISLEQSFRIAEKTAEFGNSKYIDRLKASAVAGQLASLVGMKAADAQFIQQKGAGIKTASAEDQKRFAELMPQFKDLLSQAKGKGEGFEGLEASVNHLESMLGPMSNIIDNAGSITGKGKALDKKQAAAANSQSSNLGKTSQHLADLKNMYDETILPWYKDPAVTLATGAIGSILGGLSTMFGTVIAGAVGAAVISQGPVLMTAAAKAVGVGLAGLPLLLAGAAGIALGNALAPITRGFITWLDGIFGTDVWGKIVNNIGGGINDLFAMMGISENENIKKSVDAEEKRKTKDNSLATIAKQLAPQIVYDNAIKRRKTQASSPNSLLPSTPLTDDSRTTMRSQISKGMLSIKQLEKRLPSGMNYERIGDLQNAPKASQATDDQLQKLLEATQAQLEINREILAASKGTVSAVNSASVQAATDEKYKRDQKQQELDDKAAEDGHQNANNYQAARS